MSNYGIYYFLSFLRGVFIMEHYYTNNPTTESREKIINSTIANENLKFYTDNGVFSKRECRFWN